VSWVMETRLNDGRHCVGPNGGRVGWWVEMESGGGLQAGPRMVGD
jgi:hypothetical protein